MAIYKILIIIHHYLFNNTATAGGVYMTSGDYLDKILDRMTSTHNITRNFTADGRTFATYALYEASSEKYVLSRKANLWKVSESEHVLFMTLPENADPGADSGADPGADSEADSGAGPGANSSADPEALFDEAGRLISDYMEPVLSRGNEKYPPKDHMRTFLTAVLVLERFPGPELIRKVRRYRFDKSYLFSLRGFSQGRIIVVDLPSKRVYTSPAAKDVAAFFRQAL